MKGMKVMDAYRPPGLYILAEDGTRFVRDTDHDEAALTNLRLVAAAPDLLKALKEIVNYPRLRLDTELLANARAAIKAATA